MEREDQTSSDSLLKRWVWWVDRCTHILPLSPSCLQGGGVTTTSEQGDPLVCLAASGGHCAALEVLIDCGADLTQLSKYACFRMAHYHALTCGVMCVCSAGVVTVPSMQPSGEAMGTAPACSCSSGECTRHAEEGLVSPSTCMLQASVCHWCRSGCNPKVVNRAGLTAAQTAHEKGYSQLTALLSAHVGSAVLRTLLK